MAFANLIDGRAIAAQIQGELIQRVAALKARGIQPGLAFVRVGEDPASKVYVGRKERACADLGIFSETQVLPESTSESELLVAPGDIVRFSETIIDVLTNDFSRYEQLSNRSAQVAEKFSWPPIARDTVEEYRRRFAPLSPPHAT